MKISKKVFLSGTILLLVVLALVAILTAWRMGKLGTRPIAPSVPESKPEAAGEIPNITPASGCIKLGTVFVATTTPRPPTATPTGVLTLTPTPTRGTATATPTRPAATLTPTGLPTVTPIPPTPTPTLTCPWVAAACLAGMPQKIHVSWGDIVGDVNYDVYRNTNDSTEYTKIATVPDGGSANHAYDDAAITSGISYYYYINPADGRLYNYCRYRRLLPPASCPSCNTLQVWKKDCATCAFELVSDLAQLSLNNYIKIHVYYSGIPQDVGVKIIKRGTSDQEVFNQSNGTAPGGTGGFWESPEYRITAAGNYEIWGLVKVGGSWM